MSPSMEDVLRAMGESGDIIKAMHRTIAGLRWSGNHSFT